MRNLFFMLMLGLVILSGCNSEEIKQDPKLFGKWQNANSVYQFTSSNNFYVKYLRKDYTIDTLQAADSLFGTYKVDSKIDNIIFDVKGYRKNDGSLVSKNINMLPYHYSISNDTILNLESNVEISKLFKRP